MIIMVKLKKFFVMHVTKHWNIKKLEWINIVDMLCVWVVFQGFVYQKKGVWFAIKNLRRKILSKYKKHILDMLVIIK